MASDSRRGVCVWSRDADNRKTEPFLLMNEWRDKVRLVRDHITKPGTETEEEKRLKKLSDNGFLKSLKNGCQKNDNRDPKECDITESDISNPEACSAQEDQKDQGQDCDSTENKISNPEACSAQEDQKDQGQDCDSTENKISNPEACSAQEGQKDQHKCVGTLQNVDDVVSVGTRKEEKDEVDCNVGNDATVRGSDCNVGNDATVRGSDC